MVRSASLVWQERAFRMWINSLGLETHATNLYDDIHDGLMLLQTMDHVRPGTVDWPRVNKLARTVFTRAENNNYAVNLGKAPFAFSLVGVQAFHYIISLSQPVQ